MADLPIAEDNGQLPVIINDPVTVANSLAVAANGSLRDFADYTGTGTIAALNAVVVATTNGCGAVTFNTLGTWVATLTFQGTADGTNWFTVYGVDIGTDVITQFIQTNIPVTVPCGGLLQVRMAATAYTSGTANIAWNAGAGSKELIAVSPVASSFQTTANLQDSALSVTATAATGVAVTTTLPAIAGQFHHITSLEIVAYTTAARTGGATPILVTSTNLPGSNVWDFATAAAIGTTDTKFYTFLNPYKSSVVNTATTIVCPATAGIIWRTNVMYFGL